MRTISFILIHVCVIAISQDIFAFLVPDGDYDFGYIWPENETESIILPSHEDKVSPRAKSAVQSSEECFCTYDPANYFVRARVGYRLLKTGDRIMRGETAAFECRYVNTVLTWENGLRFFGRANMTCSSCEKWDKSILPTCKPAVETEAVLGYEEDLAVLPDGTVELQKGRSYRFFCSNVWKQPEWIYRLREDVFVFKSDHNGDIYVSYLDIFRVKDDHSGMYECFSRRPGGRQTLSTFLHIKVVEKSEKNRTSAAVFPTNRVSPRENTTLKPLENPDMNNNSKCSCVYIHDDITVTALVGKKILKRGDRIKFGETVSLECSGRIGRYPLSWINNLRYRGKVQITCSVCMQWSAGNLPSCPPIRGSYITSEQNLTFLPGGILYMKTGESLNISCHSPSFPIQWIYETEENFNERKTQIPFNKPQLQIENVTYGHRGMYKCVSMPRQLELVSLKLEVGDSASSVRCPRHYATPGLRVVYSNAALSVGSIARFSCSPSRKRRGIIFSRCQEDGTWSDTAPKCEDSVICPRHLATPELQVNYSADLSVGSIATFSCSSSSSRTSGSAVSMCREDGTWSNAPPKCEDSKCSLENLLASLPDHMFLDMTNVTDEFTPGSEVQLKCENSILDGKSKVMCGERGHWKLGTLRCVPGCFVNRGPSSKLLVDPMKDSYRFGEFIFLTCPPSYRLSTTVERLICLSDGWSDVFPECIPSEGELWK